MEAPVVQADVDVGARRMSAMLPVYIGTIFLSAFLLFGIQPMFAKMVLPKLGGSPAVWSTAMVFFQAILLAGYAYAHWLVSRFSVRRAALIHIALMIVVVATSLPIGIAAGFERPPQQGEFAWLLLLFAASVGLPFFAVSANGPLLQAWFARTGHAHARDPYFLYAASNIGSFLALLAYPFAVEPALRLATQASAWAWGFGLLLAGITACAGLCVGSVAGTRDTAPLMAEPIPAGRKLHWLFLAFVPSGLLVAVTAHISTDVAAGPLLWVAPLALFLLTFVIVFQRKPLLRHGWMLNVQLLLVLCYMASMVFNLRLGWGSELVLHLSILSVTAMVAHGELARLRPSAAELTSFYLWMSFGGVLGGVFAALLAPLLFNSVAEYPLLVVAGMLCRPGFTSVRPSRRQGAALACLAVVAMTALIVRETTRTDMVRSFFGVHRISEMQAGRFRVLSHGSTIHGAQRLRQDDGTPVSGRPEPLTYYFTGGGIADGIDSVRQARGGTLGAVAAIGVGTGSLACQARTGEDWHFYEIDPAVIGIATDPARFSFFSACAPKPTFVIGDARLTLGDASNGSLDLIVVDAFSSDAIPVHLLTSEALALYMRKLKPDGAVLLHISNRNMELQSVVRATAAGQGLTTWINSPVRTEADLQAMKTAPSVAVVTRPGVDPGPAVITWKQQVGPGTTRPWSDDYADIVGAIWRQLSPK
ncbi:fused MFS/spermidine synthase [Bosea sp. FBZP-16]|uniref:fused MFS/spermidine synthase n=1 Tax=Bosea sp. FBZP-16 TaxID=2065382 RepID=UPI000C307D8F|nr:fused MFS/spermidine synthase [Bosea sp. FBZP-16]